MPVATFEKVMTDLKNKQYQPVYFLQGQEIYFIDRISNFIEENVLSESEKSFNLTVRHGRDSVKETGKMGGTFTRKLEYTDLINDLTRLPMMSEYQVVILKEAQEFKDLPLLQSYVEKPNPATIFVICHNHKKVKMNTKFGKALSKNAVVVTAEKVPEWKIADWIISYVSKNKLKISKPTAQLLGEYLGSDLSKVVNEIDKLKITLKAGDTISPAIIEANIGISKNYNVFELQNAIVANDKVKITRIINYFIANPKSAPFQMTMGALFTFFAKVYSLHAVRHKSQKEKLAAIKSNSSFALKQYEGATRTFSKERLEEIFSILKEYDLKSKGLGFNTIGKNVNILLQEMVFRILN